jgi:uncharacterized glyoxalase superfamily protein PhnB
MIIPATRYHDPEAALAFLTQTLGFVEHAVFRDETGVLIHAQLTASPDGPQSGMVMIGPTGNAAEPNEFDAFMIHPADTGGRETVSIYAVVPDVASRYARAVAAGLQVLIALRSEPYGGLSFTIRDPEGHIWTLGSYDPTQPARGT